MTRSDTVHVYANLERFGQPALMGALHCQQSPSGEISPSYDETWLAIDGWLREANRFHIPKAERDLVAPAFEW